MSNSGANAIPLLTPYKMGKFDISHRYALFFGWTNPNPQSSNCVRLASPEK